MHQTYSPHITTTTMNPQFPEHEQLKCPRCDSRNTKFCYFNNYSLTQPRHFCKNCRRYWTRGGTRRNIPVGGGTRKTTAKRASSSSKRPADSDSPTTTESPPPPQDESKAETETSGISGYRSDPMKLDGESFESILKPNQRLQFEPNLSGADSPPRNSPVTTPSPPPLRAEETSMILGYRSDPMKLDGENFESMLKSNQRFQFGPNLSGADSPPRNSPVTTPSPSPPPPLAESKAEMETETSGSLGYRSDRMKLDGESFESMLKSNRRVEFGSFVDGLRSNLTGGSEEDGVIPTPANTGVFRKQFLSLKGDGNESAGGGCGGGGGGGSW